MSRRRLIAGNWKLNPDLPGAERLANALRSALVDGSADVLVFPPALTLSRVVDLLAGTPLGIGVQEVEVAPSGAWTGANSAVVARQLGCTHALVGHSERRKHYGDTDARVGARLRAALDAGLCPVLCVGETLAQRRAGHQHEIVHRQLSVALADVPPDRLSGLVVAYEPVWAIGTGETATPPQAQDVHHSIRRWLTANVGPWAGDDLRILYGGSVKPTNAADLLRCPDIDGALVGGASLNADGFAAIARA